MSMQTLKNNNGGSTFSSDQPPISSDKNSFNNTNNITVGYSSSGLASSTPKLSTSSYPVVTSSSSNTPHHKKNLTPLTTALTSNSHQERKHHHSRKDHTNVNNTTYYTPSSNNGLNNNKSNDYEKLSRNNNNTTIMVTPPQKPQQSSTVQHPTKSPLVESHRYSRQAQTLHASAQYDKAARCSRKALSVLERAKNYTCDSNALESIDWMASHYRSNYRYQKNMFEAVTAPYGSTISNGGSTNNNFSNNNSQRTRSQPRKNNVVVTEKYGDRQVIMPNEEDLGESMIGDLVMTPFNNTPTPTTACTSLYSELYAMFIHPWLQYQKVLEDCSENAQLKGLFSKTIMTTQQRLYQLMQKTQSLEDSENMNASSAVSPVNTSTAMHTDLSKKLLSLTYSLNADKATRLSQQILKKDREVELLKRKIKEQQDIISQHEENWRLMKLEAEKTLGTSQEK
ncbi:hypothetical protein C9374_012475 [Naegleria lovaniensis]|uniref:Uncharacterized protein n=1 Tax=Naegleria lovaniensis TaxID=51637 RepID=A0AA88GWB9_NAELO|nr:uncharacterized protein C9374_012475 [Naegleria lovaniensis]KAG2392223.1 hypothetical protein C9374_012475 [Naegleria lovaniensis]